MRSIAKLGLAAVTTASLSAVLLAGCGSGGSAAGPDCADNWTLSSMSNGSQSYGGNELDQMKDLGLDVNKLFALELAKDGKATMTVMDQTGKGTWVAKDGKCAITIEGSTIIAPITNGELVLDVDGATMSFKRSK